MAENPEHDRGANSVTVGVVKESASGETRVGLIPDSVKHLIGKGIKVVVEQGAGNGSSIADDEYRAPGATIADSAADVYAASDVVVRVQAPSPERGELDHLKHGQILVSFLAPLVNHDLNSKLAESGVTALAVDAVPRITRAQSMDALSAMSTIAGYKAVLLAADHLPKFFPLLMTAAGTIRPARVLVLGAGVAGLQAIATARRLGAVVDAYDTRAVVKEQVESLGANFVEIDTGAGDAEAAGGYAREATPEELRRQQEGLNDYIAKADVVVTTALVPGRPAPKLIPAEAVERMRHGSVIVDLAAETGGNCELTTPGEITQKHGITIIGTLNLPATLPVHASQMYAKVITNFLDLLIKDAAIDLNFEDDIIAGMGITHRGEIVQEQTRKAMGIVQEEPPTDTEGDSSIEPVAEGVEPESSAGDDDNVVSPAPPETDESLVGEDLAEPVFEGVMEDSSQVADDPSGEALFDADEPVLTGESAVVTTDDPESEEADPVELKDIYSEAKGASGVASEPEETALLDAPADDAVVYVDEEKNGNG
jgi:H+-translocating NAD(P) transhydrogenase subunit alpha